MTEPHTVEAWLHTYGPGLIRYAYSITNSSAAAEDAMEDAFAALLVKDGKFHDEQQLRSWLYKTTRNKAVDFLRRHRREQPLEDVENVIGTETMEQGALLQERNRRLYLCLQELPLQYREVLELTYLEGFPIEAVCAILRKTKKQVYNLLARAKVSLREKLIQEGITHEDI